MGYIDSDTFLRTSDNTFIVFDVTNPTYQQFKIDITNGVQLNDETDSPMTLEQITDFLATLP